MLSAILALLMGCSGGSPYSKKDGVWYFEKVPVPVPAGETLTVINRRFAKSATMAFYRDTPIPGAHVPSFEALSEHYARDRSHVWWADTYRNGQEYYLIVHARITPLEGADPATFVALDQDYGRDRARVWYEGKAFTADAATFEVLDYGYGRDAVSGYYMREPIPGSDGKTFRVLNSAWSRDAGRVFFSEIDLNTIPPRLVNRTAEQADTESFEALDGGYGKDRSHVFYEGRIIEGADPATFVVDGVSTNEAKDKNGSYKDGVSTAAAAAAAPPAETAEPQTLEEAQKAEPTAEP